MSRILLIDDDNQVNEVMKATLEMLGHTVRTLETADQADAESADFNPDMTLIDYMLPGRSGLEILRELNQTQPHSVRCLATGMADFNVLQQALEAGASSMLCKPYRLADIVALLDSAALLDAALKQEIEPTESPERNVFRFTRSATTPVQGSDLARLSAVARQWGADSDTITRRLPIVASELMKNAARHGAVNYEVEIRNERELSLVVHDDGPGFDWAKVVARARCGMDKARASGLQVVLAMVNDIYYENGGRTATVKLSKKCGAE